MVRNKSLRVIQIALLMLLKIILRSAKYYVTFMVCHFKKEIVILVYGIDGLNWPLSPFFNGQSSLGNTDRRNEEPHFSADMNIWFGSLPGVRSIIVEVVPSEWWWTVMDFRRFSGLNIFNFFLVVVPPTSPPPSFNRFRLLYSWKRLITELIKRWIKSSTV